MGLRGKEENGSQECGAGSSKGSLLRMEGPAEELHLGFLHIWVDMKGQR